MRGTKPHGLGTRGKKSEGSLIGRDREWGATCREKGLPKLKQSRLRGKTEGYGKKIGRGKGKTGDRPLRETFPFSRGKKRKPTR